jgi:hypothetical protein
MRALLVTAPARLREQLSARRAAASATSCSQLEAADDLSDLLAGTTAALGHLAAPLPGPGRRDHRPGPPAGPAGQTIPARPARPQRSRHRNRRPAADHLRRQPQPAHQPSRLRLPLWPLAGAGLQRQDPATSPQPRRRPTARST